MTDDEILLCAFRYVLGRSSHLVPDIAEHLIEVWPMVGERAQEAIIDEVVEALNDGKAGDDVDVESWKDFLENVDMEYLDRVNKCCSHNLKCFMRSDCCHKKMCETKIMENQ